MANDDGQLILGALLGFGLGIYTFLKGFRTFREFRVVADTPEIPIRSMPMGLVHIRGQARSDESLLSPVTHTPCYLFQVVVEEWHSESEGGGEWKHVATDVQSVKFYLEDKSGNVLVDATGVELDLPGGPTREVPSGQLRSRTSQALGAGHATEAEVLQYVEQARLRHFTQMVGQGIGALTHTVEPARKGSLAPLLGFLANPTGSGTSALQAVMMRTIMARRDPTGQTQRAALEVWKHQPGTPEFKAALTALALTSARTLQGKQNVDPDALVAQAQQNPAQALRMSAVVAGAADPQTDPEAERARQAALAYTKSHATSSSRNISSGAQGHFRLTECCLLPGQTYDLTGTCAENPHARDQFDRNIILQGTNEPTFLISSRTLQQVEAWLRKRSFAMVLGGAALAVVCLAILLWKAGLF